MIPPLGLILHSPDSFEWDRPALHLDAKYIVVKTDKQTKQTKLTKQTKQIKTNRADKTDKTDKTDKAEKTNKQTALSVMDQFFHLDTNCLVISKQMPEGN